MARKFLDTDHPMFRPLWVRALIVGGTGLWALFELYLGNALWFMIFGALAAYAGWGFFVTYDRDRKDE